MRGIYVVANDSSEALCANLIYSIRKSGCNLPIRLIPFGGKPVQSNRVLKEVEVWNVERFPSDGQKFVGELAEVLVDCPRGFLYRFLPWFSEWDEFIYTDNDVVALMNWELLLDYLCDNYIVHADEEYITQGLFNYEQPDKIEDEFGTGSLLSAMTAGHFAARRDAKLVEDMRKAIEWFKKNPAVAKKHDQAFIHVASLIGNWSILNLCKSPHNWLSSWAGDYRNPLALMHALQTGPAKRISHLHFSGGRPIGTEPTADFLNSNLDTQQRTIHLTKLGLLQLSGLVFVRRQTNRIKNELRRRWKKVLASNEICNLYII
jgi:hypothetical protein